MSWCRPETLKRFSTRLQLFNIVGQHKINSNTIEQPNTNQYKYSNKPESPDINLGIRCLKQD